MKRKVLSVLLALSMMLTLLPVTALAEETAPKETETPVVEEPAPTAETLDPVESTVPAEAPKADPVLVIIAPDGTVEEKIGILGASYATDGSTVKLLKDITSKSLVYFGEQGASITLDLNGKTLGAQVYVDNGRKLTVTDSSANMAPVVDGNHKVTYNAGKIVNSETAVIVSGTTSTFTLESGMIEANGGSAGVSAIQGGTAIINGGYILSKEFGVLVEQAGSTATVNGGVIETKDNAVVGGNGVKDHGGTTINISGGQLIGHIQSDGYIACGVYHPQAGQLNITGGDIYVDGGVGVLMRAGQMNMTGGTITATGTVSGKVGDSKNTANCYGIQLDYQSKYPGNSDLSMAATVSGTATVCADSTMKALGVLKAEDQAPAKTIEVAGGTFSDLTSAVEYAADGATIKLANDVTLDKTITLNKDITIDLGGHTVTADTAKLVDRAFMFKSTADHVIIQNGSITAATCRGINVASGEFALKNVQMSTFKRALAIDNATATVDKDSVISILKDGPDAPIIVWGTGDYKTDNIAHHPTVHVYGKVDATQAQKPYAAVQGNGTDHSYTYIYIYPGAELTSRGTGIYAPQAGEVHVSGGTVTGDGAAIGIKSGILDITGGVLKATDPYGADIESMSGGINTDGSVIVIDSNNAYAGEMKVNISGDAVLNSANGHVVREIGKADDQTSIVSLNIEGGNFISKLAPVNTRPITDNTVAVSGGTFAQDVDNKYIADNAAKATVTAADGTVKYAVGQKDIQDAVIAAGSNAQVDVTKGDVELTNVPQDTTVKNSGTGKVTADGETVNSGSTITPNPKPSHGGGSSSHSGDYLVNVDRSKNGTVSVSPKWADKGDTVTITVKPDKGYELDELIVTDKNGDEIRVKSKGNDKYTFTMPSGKVNVEVVFAEIKAQDLPFADVSRNAYYYDAVVWALKNGITSGVTPDTFQPYASCTRAQTVTFLWRAAGCPAPVNTVNPFTDVVPGAYYYDAVLWAVEKGITKGITDTTFQPNATVTRGQTVTFLYRYAGSPAAETATAFVDVASGSYCEGAVQWAVENGITNGTTNVTFGPADVCTRGQIVSFLYRFAK